MRLFDVIMAFKPLIFVHSYSNIILQHQFFARGCLEAVLPQTWFCLKNKDFTFYWNYIVSIVIVIVIGNFHIKDNDLKFTNTWQWLFLTNSVFFAWTAIESLKITGGFETALLWEFWDFKLGTQAFTHQYIIKEL